MSDSGSMWINMLGLGPLFQTINDPAFQLHIRQIVESIGETAERCKRIEAKLDRLMEAQPDGWDCTEPRRLTHFPAQLGPSGNRRHTVAGGVADDGTGHGQAGAESDTGRSGPGNGQDRAVGALAK